MNTLLKKYDVSILRQVLTILYCVGIIKIVRYDYKTVTF